MRQRHAAAGIAAFLTMVIGAGAALAGGPTTASGRPDWVQEGTSRTFDLADGARVHTLPLRTDQSASVAPAAAQVGALAGFGIDYHGGPIVPAESVTAIYWSASQIYAGGPQPGTSGNGAADGSLVGYFLRNLGGSPYYNINTTYADTVGGGHFVTNTLGYTQFWADSSGAPSGSATVSDAAIQAEITKGLTSGAVAWNPSTVYAVFSSGAVNLGGGFLSSYCAYHGSFSWGANIVLYAVMPYDNAGPGTCTALAAPNGDAAGDAEVNTLAHELEEASTDPQLNAWWNSATGAENADQCAWNFGTRSLSAGQANITVGAKNFLVQQNWLNANGGLCAQSYSTVVAKDFSITESPTALSIGQGGSGGATIGTAVTSGSSATVNLSVGGAPSGTTASVSPASVSAGASSTLSVVVGSSTAPGTYPLTITGVEGSASHSAIVSLTVTGPAGVPGAATLAATRSSRRGVQLSWTVPASHGSSISAYRIYRGAASGAEALLVQLSGGTTRYRDIATTSGRLYFYRITAVNGYGEGPLSNEAPATAR